MIIYSILCNVLDKTINYSAVGKNLIEILNDIAEKFHIKISIYFSEEILVSNINIHNKSLKMVLDDLIQIYDLHYRIENNIVIIEQCEKTWKTYENKDFYEDIAFEKNENNNNNKNVSKNIQWDEIEKTLNKITDNNFVIDKYNCIIHVFGKCNVHNQVQSYIDKLNNKKQVVIELQFIEIVHDLNNNINLLNLATNILDKINQHSSKIVKTISEVVKCIGDEVSKYEHININTSSTMKLLLLSQNQGEIKVSNEITRLSNHISIQSRRAVTEIKDYKFDDGLFLTIVPLVLNDNRVILKLKQSLKTFSANNNGNQFNINNREIKTVMYANIGTPIIIGGLDANKTITYKSLFGDTFLLKYLFPHKYEHKKSQIIIIINIKEII